MAQIPDVWVREKYRKEEKDPSKLCGDQLRERQGLQRTQVLGSGEGRVVKAEVTN